MPFSNINIVLTGAQITAIQNAITALKAPANMPVQFNLTKAERKSVPNISNERYPYVQRAIQNHAPTNPNLVNGFAGTTAEATNDLTFYDQMKSFILQLRQVTEIYEDTQQVAGSEAYTFTRVLYNTSKDASANQVPGADAVADDLGTLFEGQGTAALAGTFTANPSAISAGQPSTLSRNITGSASVAIDNGIGAVTPSGNLSVTPAQTTTYNLTATAPDGETLDLSATVTVTDVQPPPAP
ncbi:MAG: hypothetical protein HY841_06255 [Bacteroidetes bacterium]|nr:hypothetical protein [Bacteroidota bacterium]